MEIKDVFISTAVVLIAVIGILTWLSSMNTAYGVEAGSSFNQTFARVQGVVNNSIGGMAVGIGNNTGVPEGGATGDQQDSLIEQSRSTFSLTRDLMGLVPALIDDGASVVGIPQVYRTIGKWIFYFVFGLTIAYLLLLGARRILPG